MSNTNEDRYNDLPNNELEDDSDSGNQTQLDSSTWNDRLMTAISELEYIYHESFSGTFCDIGNEEMRKIIFLFKTASSEAGFDANYALYNIYESAKAKHVLAVEHGRTMDSLQSPNMEALIDYCENYIQNGKEQNNDK